MPRWRIYYAGGATYSDSDGSPFDAPKRGALVIVRADRQVGRIVIFDCHYYCWRDDVGWFGVGKTDTLGAGLVEYLMEAGPRVVLFGYTVTNEEFNNTMRAAMNDADFDIKSARHPIEDFNAPVMA